MSASPFFYIEKFNRKTNKWEEVRLFTLPDVYSTKEEKEAGYAAVDVWPYNGTHEIFGMLGAEHSYGDPIDGIHTGLPFDVSETIAARYKNIIENDIYERDPAHYVTLANLKIAYLKKPNVIDYDEYWIGVDEEDNDKRPMKENPIKDLIDRIETFVELSGDWFADDPSDIRLVYWLLW